ncbi:hypothetical protein K3495_g14357, partial [Podosphaera aphanis]
MDECLQPIRDITSNMIDDVITWGNTIAEATNNASLVMKRLESCGYKLNPRKCAWFVTQTRFLGHIIDRNGIQVDPSKIQAILDRPIPRTVTEVRAFLNSCNYFRDYVKLFSKLAGPLYCLTSLEGKNVPVTLTDEQIKSWKATRNALITTPILKPMDPQLPVVLDVDASEKYTGGVLLQPKEPFTPVLRVAVSQPTMDGANLHPVAYTSHKLNPTQQRYSAQEREALGIVQALQTWQDWIEGCDIIIRTDHESLAGIRKKSNLPRRMQRFVDILEHFDPTIIYKRGKSNYLADWLSRPPTKVTTFPIQGFDPVHEDSTSQMHFKIPDIERLTWI